MRQPRPISRHPVAALDRADCGRVFVGPRIAHHADALHRQQHREALPEALVPPRLADFLRDDLVREAQQVEARPGDFSDDSHRQSRARERLADDELLVEAEIAADAADFVFEQVSQWLDQRERHPLRQAADVVMALDDHRRAMDRCGFDHIRVERPLRQKIEAAKLVGARLEHVDEGRADDLPLLLGIGHAGEPLEERARRIDEVERQLHLLAEALDDLVRLVVAQQPVVHEDARQPIADRAMNEHRGDR